MTTTWLVWNIALGLLAVSAVVGLPLWALRRYSADALFGSPVGTESRAAGRPAAAPGPVDPPAPAAERAHRERVPAA